jgi:hypothetical protein
MRYTILFLIALNCAYFTWQMAVSASDSQVVRARPPLPPGVRRLVMLQEHVKDQPPATASAETRKIEDLTATEPPGAVVPLSCQALGPVLAQSELQSLQQRLATLGLNVRPQTRYIQEQVGYTVLLPPREYDDALKTKRQLENNNFTASIVGINNEISLGAFRDKSDAEKTFARADGMGLAPRLEPSYAKRSTYWLVLPERDSKDAKLAAVTRKYPGLRVENLTCP